MNESSLFTPERLYEMLPAIHRIRDAEDGALRALVEVLARQAQIVEADIARLYDNAFIETCEEWVVPYIGALLGVRGLHPVEGTRVRSHRAYVANTLRFRRRKGTATMLEQLTLDVTGWPARAVEFFERLATTQNLNHLRPHVHLPNLRDTASLELVDGPFDAIPHTAGVRHLPEGRHNVPNVGLFVWRLQPYPVQRGMARAVTTRPGLFTFDPLGRSRALFNPGSKEDDIAHLAEERDVPGALRRRALYDELEARRQAIADGEEPAYVWFDDRVAASAIRGPVLRVWADGQEIRPERIDICNLEQLWNTTPEDWQRPPANRVYDIAGSDPPKQRSFVLNVAVDPELGRIAFRANKVPQTVEVSYDYAFPGDVGGGPYDGSETDEAAILPAFPPPHLRNDPGPFTTLKVPSAFPDVAAALQAVPAAGDTLIAIEDSHSYAMPAAFDLPDGDLVIQAGIGQRPVLAGDVTFKGKRRSRLALSGLLLEGSVTMQGRLAALTLLHATVVPGRTLDVATAGSGGEVTLWRSVCGPIAVAPSVRALAITHSIVDARSATAIAAGETEVTIDRCTIVGTVNAHVLSASNSIMTGLVVAARRQQGCVRFCWLPPESVTAQPFRCQPALALADLVGARAAETRQRLVPAFTSLDYASHGYTQLARSCPAEIRTGADDGSEMGVWNFLQQPQREANLAAALDEYLRFGLEAGLIFVS